MVNPTTRAFIRICFLRTPIFSKIFFNMVNRNTVAIIFYIDVRYTFRTSNTIIIKGHFNIFGICIAGIPD